MQLYRLTSPSGKSYIGICRTTAERRFRGHVREAKSGKRALCAAIRKYGPETFTVQTLTIVNDWEYLCDLEVKAIQLFNTCAPSGYNLTKGGDGTLGRKDTEETRRKRKASGIGNKNGSGNKGRKFTKEHCEKLRAPKVGNKNAFGHVPTEEQCRAT